MMGLVDRALVLNPSFARGWYLSGFLRVFAGQPDLAIEHLETSLRLSPRERLGTPLSIMGGAYFFKRQFDEAASKLLLAIYSCRVLCLSRGDRRSEGGRHAAPRHTPLVVPSVLSWRNPEHRELFLSGLRLAMGETS
jgi:adenylate cyclase